MQTKSRRVRAFLSLTVLTVAWGGSIPWFVYLVTTHEAQWWMLLILVPFYAYLTWFVWHTYWPIVTGKK
jgi:hypothetical protein